MKTEEVRATKAALTPYTTLILFSLPESCKAQTTILGSSVDNSSALVGANHNEGVGTAARVDHELECADFIPNFRRIVIIGHQFVNAD